MRYIVLDSGPLALVTHRHDAGGAADCIKWAAAKMTQGVLMVVPEVVDYELRRELIRAGKINSVKRLNAFNTHSNVIYLPITTQAMRRAAELWATLRQRGLPTADEHALDGDVILAAQVLEANYPAGEFVVATSNANHLSRMVPANNWPSI